MKDKLKHYILYSICITILTGLICLSVRALSFSTLFLDPVGQTLKGFRFTDSYFYIQNSSTDISEITQDFV